jgi:hypothetical protein
MADVISLSAEILHNAQRRTLSELSSIAEPVPSHPSALGKQYGRQGLSSSTTFAKCGMLHVNILLNAQYYIKKAYFF